MGFSTSSTILSRLFGVAVLTTAVTLFCTPEGVFTLADDDFDSYDYGENVEFDALERQQRGDPDLAGLSQAVREGSTAVNKPLPLPLCCPEGQVYDHVKCIIPPPNFDWEPLLESTNGAKLEFNGFPKCPMKRDYVQTYQKEVHFNIENAQVFLPYHVKLLPVKRNDFCIAKVYDPVDLKCKEFQTKIFTCFSEEKDPKAMFWFSVSISHFFILFSLAAFFLVGDLRCLQGQYLICFLISLLIYNLCLLPGSYFPMNISDISCISLGAVKYFFFCGIFLWFNTICFDIWRTLRRKEDLSGRRRFLCYSAYSWVLSAILTTVVLVLPYLKEQGAATQSTNDPLKDSNYDTCKLKIPMNMILQIAQVMSLVIDLVFLILASCSICSSYSKFGSVLPKCDASLCLKQGWKLFFIMVAHTISCIDKDIVNFPVPIWLFLLLESAAVFGVFAYRRTIFRKLANGGGCSPRHLTRAEPGSSLEKGHLTLT